MRTRLLLLGGQTIALGLTMAFLVVPVSALFLNEYGARALPYVYLVVAVAGVTLSAVMSRAQRRVSLAGLAQALLATYLVLVLAGWVVLATSDGLWITFPLLVLLTLSIPIGFMLVGSQAGRLLDVRQMKAHFPRVAAGFSVGFAIGGLAAAALVGPLGGPEPLLALDSLTALAMLGLARETARRYPAELRTPPVPSPASAPTPDPTTSVRWLRANRLVVLIFGYQVLSAAVTQLLDFMVWERAAVRYPDASDLARFQGVFGAVINVTSVAFVVLLAGWLLTRFGIGLGLAANPLGVLVLLAATTVVGFTSGALSLTFFTLVCAQQVTDISFSDGTTRASINATYQALPTGQRLRAQTVIEGAGVPVAMGSVGALLIVFQLLDLEIRAIVATTFVLAIGWLVLAVLAYRAYGAKLRHVLTLRAWDPLGLRIDDDASRRAVEQLLESTDARDVHAALDALTDAGHADVSRHLLALLADPDPERRELGVEVAATSERLEEDAIGEAVRRLLHDDEPRVAMAAAAALAGLGAGRCEAGRSAWLAAIVSGEPAMVRAGLHAVVLLPHRYFVPYLVGLASEATASAELLDALAAQADLIGPRVAVLLDDPSVPRPTRERVIHVLGMSGTARARDALLAHLDDGDQSIVEAAARSLLVLGHGESADEIQLERRLHDLARRTGCCLQILTLLEATKLTEPLRDALHDEIAAAARRAEVLLEMVHDARAIGSGVAGLSSAVERERSSALEMLEVTVGRSVAGLALAILDPTVDAVTRRRLLQRREPVPEASLEVWLRRLILDDEGFWHDPWLGACALYAATGHLPEEALCLMAVRLVDHPDPDLAQTARWAMQPRSPHRAASSAS